MKLKAKISWLMGTVQQSLFPYLDESLPDPLTGPERQLVKILELVQVEQHVPVSRSRQWLGRPLKEREAIARAFVAKALLRYQHTRALRNALLSSPNLRIICGFGQRQEVPSESTFSRAFAEYAQAGLGTVVHDALVRGHLGSELIGHISRDSTSLAGREKPVKKVKVAKVAKKRGRPAKGEVRPLKRLDRQRLQTAEDGLAELPKACDRGVKKNAKGYAETWHGYKLHLDVNDCGLPISAVLTSASVHDSQVAIPLMKLSAAKVTSCYDLMDAAYDASQIWEQSKALGHVPVIDRNPRSQKIVPMAPHEAARYQERTAAERCNGRFKDEFGGRSVQVRGPDKVMMHAMFGIVTLFADQLLKVTGC